MGFKKIMKKCKKESIDKKLNDKLARLVKFEFFKDLTF